MTALFGRVRNHNNNTIAKIKSTQIHFSLVTPQLFKLTHEVLQLIAHAAINYHWTNETQKHRSLPLQQHFYTLLA